MSAPVSAVMASLERLFSDRDAALSALAADDSLSEALDWDSMDVVDLGMEFKRSHGVELPDDVALIDTIAKLAAFLPPADSPAQ